MEGRTTFFYISESSSNICSEGLLFPLPETKRERERERSVWLHAHGETCIQHDGKALSGLKKLAEGLTSL